MSTLAVVDSGEVICYGNSAFRANLLALLTADAGIHAVLTGDSTLFLIAAGNNNIYILFNELNEALWTGLDASAAGNTESRINVSELICDLDSTNRAAGNTVTTANAAVLTELRATVKHICCLTALDAVVNNCAANSIAVAAAVYVSNSWLANFNLNTEDVGELGSYIRTAWDTEIWSSFALCYSSSIGITAGITAGAAVSTREALTDSLCHWVFRNSEEMGSKSQKNTGYKTDRCNNKKSIENCDHLYTLLLIKPEGFRRFRRNRRKPWKRRMRQRELQGDP